MDHTITYNLREDTSGSDGFYMAISAFADDWTARALPGIADLVEGFRAECGRRGVPDRSPEACAYDLLVLGVLLREHGGESARIPGWGESLLRGLLKLQESWPKGEFLVKAGRGFVYRIARILKGKKTAARPNTDSLLAWLRATGENTIADRLEAWRNYFKSCNIGDESTGRVLQLADDFAKDSLAALGGYTPRVEYFLEVEAPRHRWRYDIALLNHNRLEYHLGMLGYEILNRSYRQAFVKSTHKIVILPPCMRAQPEKKCRAELTRYGEKCAACTPSCRIHQVTKLGEKRGFDVFIIPEELRVFGSGKRAGEMSGVVGVSCVLTNWTGGWDAERLGIPVQGVLLDYVGCKYHWDLKGFPTDINLRRLIQVLGLD